MDCSVPTDPFANRIAGDLYLQRFTSSKRYLSLISLAEIVELSFLRLQGRLLSKSLRRYAIDIS